MKYSKTQGKTMNLKVPYKNKDGKPMKDAFKKKLEEYTNKRRQTGVVSKPQKPFKPGLPSDAKPKPMPKPPARPVSGRPVSGMPGMTYRNQKQRVMAKLKQMRENA